MWNILDKAIAYKPEAKRCLLCLTEKYIFSKLNLLNSRNELVTKCRHENRFYLANFKDHVHVTFQILLTIIRIGLILILLVISREMFVEYLI